MINYYLKNHHYIWINNIKVQKMKCLTQFFNQILSRKVWFLKVLKQLKDSLMSDQINKI